MSPRPGEIAGLPMTKPLAASEHMILAGVSGSSVTTTAISQSL
jgi:hypothetical protein